jgi:hypothetical protein
MSESLYHNRRAVVIENERVRLTVLADGGHIAEFYSKSAGVNPLWKPQWPSIDPSTYDEARHPEYGSYVESRVLSGMMGHFLCMDMFGGPSPEETAAGISVHGEAPVVPYNISTLEGELIAGSVLPAAQLRFERRIRLDGPWARISETVENLSSLDRPIAWTQHVNLGSPFLEKGATQIRMPATRARVLEADFGEGSYMNPGSVFDWPHVPTLGGGTSDLSVFTKAEVSGGFTTQLMNPGFEKAFLFAWAPKTKVLFGYVWKRSDFPWVGIWEENCSRLGPPWLGKTMTLGLEFSTSPIPESRRQMIERGRLFGEACYRWIPARTSVGVQYSAFITTAEAIPEREEDLKVV